LNHIKNKVTDFTTDGTVFAAVDFVDLDFVRVNPRIGASPYPVYSLPFAGLDPATGDPQGYLGKTISKDYQALLNQGHDTANLTYHGSALPTYFGFLTNTVSYKGFSLTMSLKYSLGYYFRKNALMYSQLIKFVRPHADYANRWQAPGDELITNIPSMQYPFDANRDRFFQISSANIFRGDNIRFEYILLNYQLPAKLLQRTPFRSVGIYGSMNNIGIIWRANDAGLDPEVNTGNSPYPRPFRIGAGLKIEFKN
jgi:TonB-dependent starch-binding outer membrane protein SusC